MKELLSNGTIVENIISVLVIGAIVYLSVTNQQIPQELGNIAMVIVGFYFGQKINSNGVH